MCTDINVLLPLRMLEAGVMYELKGLEGVTGIDGVTGEEQPKSERSASLPRLLDGRLSFCRTASSWRRSAVKSQLFMSIFAE